MYIAYFIIIFKYPLVCWTNQVDMTPRRKHVFRMLRIVS